MLDELKSLNQIKGVKGVCLVGPEGDEIASHFLFPVAAGLVKSLVAAVRRAAGEITDGVRARGLTQALVEAAEGKFFVQAVASGYLVVLADGQANAGMIRIELAQAGPLVR